MGLRNLRSRIRDSRSGDTTDPLGQADTDPWLDELTPDPDEDTDPGGADLASVDPLPAGAVRNRQNVYVDGRRCAVCHVPSISEVCVKCKLAGHLPPGMDVYVPPGMDRPLPDPPLHRLDGAGYVLEPLPDVADFDEARDRLRTEVIGRIHADGAA